MQKSSTTLLSLLLLFVIEGCFADDDDLDLEFEFARHQKSTLENFPMQAIDQKGLSDTAIEGALLVQTGGTQKSEQNGKPIYKNLEEEEQKKQTEEVLADDEKDIVGADELLKFSQILPSQPQFQPIIYQQPTGRTYTDHQTTTVERP
tara:strand:+ start:110 stop:553 length:444 start_codon:yes stop_codon:yes gene_type:complete